jgi:hypothetical protein
MKKKVKKKCENRELQCYLFHFNILVTADPSAELNEIIGTSVIRPVDTGVETTLAPSLTDSVTDAITVLPSIFNVLLIFPALHKVISFSKFSIIYFTR